MPTREELQAVLGPLLDTMPRVLLVLAFGMAAVLAARAAWWAWRRRRRALLMLAWMVAVASVFGGAAVFEGLARVDGAFGGADRLTIASIAAFGAGRWLPLAIASGAGVLVTCIALPGAGPGGGVNAALDPKARRAATLGALGEALVTSEVEALGWPVLANVILECGRGTVEIDHLVRAPDGILVIETKTYSGFVAGTEDAAQWTQQLRDGRRFLVQNPAVQSFGHLRAVSRLIGDPTVAIRCLVVSAGSARFAAEIAHIPVPVSDLRRVLTARAGFVVVSQAAIDRAWMRLLVEAGQSERRYAAHVAYARGRRASAV
ncbi:MAG TPA: nuclease-related domain-containing protein [Acetobacteraceae bacterium]|nr:nuclease-related domain-containing protein [Acetobacteraceae bacterium]